MNKQKTARQFMQERKKLMKRYYELLQPRMHYSKDYDILAINWGQNKVEQTIELTPDLRFDVDSEGTIIGIEIDNLKDKLKEKKE